MFDTIFNRFKDICNTIVTVEQKIGFKSFRRYIIILVTAVVVLKFSTFTKSTVEFFIKMVEELHGEKMRIRDELMTELRPILTEFRATTEADRILYFEYHNSEDNLDGIPFKFFDLMMGNSRFGVPEVPGPVYKDVGSSLYSNFFDDIGDGKILHCSGAKDIEFRQTYGGVFEFINETDYSRQQVIFSIPGVRTPIGFIILEWMSDTIDINLREEIYPAVNVYIPRINALLISAKNKL